MNYEPVPNYVLSLNFDRTVKPLGYAQAWDKNFIDFFRFTALTAPALEINTSGLFRATVPTVSDRPLGHTSALDEQFLTFGKTV